MVGPRKGSMAEVTLISDRFAEGRTNEHRQGESWGTEESGGAHVDVVVN
jgi:hypothetical protein